MNFSYISSEIVKPSIKSFGQILFSQDMRVGFLVILSIAVFNPMSAIIIFGTTLACHAMANLSPWINREGYQEGLYGFNGALLSTGCLVFFGSNPWLVLALLPLSLLANQLWLTFHKRDIPLFTLPATLVVMVLLNHFHSDSELSHLEWGIQGFSQIIYVAHPLTALIIAISILLAYYKNLLWVMLGIIISLVNSLILSDNHFLSLMLANQLLFACYLTNTKRLMSQLLKIVLINTTILTLIFYLLYCLELPVMVFPYIVASMITSYMLKKQYGRNIPISL